MANELWTLYRVRWEGITKLCASVPGDADLVRRWLESREPRVRPPGSKTIDDIQEEVWSTLAAGEEAPEPQYSLLVFQRVEERLVVRAATLKAHLKDCARVLSAQYMAKIKGQRAFSTRVTNGLYTDEKVYWVPILRPDGQPVTTPDGAFDKAIHVRGPQGQPLNALKRFEYVEPWCLEFTLKILGGNSSAPHGDLVKLMEYGGVHGYAGERGDGEGKYTATIDLVST